jgi:hypothetical protein
LPNFRNIFRGFITMQLNLIQATVVDQILDLRCSVIHKHTDTRNTAGNQIGDAASTIFRNTASRGRMEIQTDGIGIEATNRLYGFFVCDSADLDPHVTLPEYTRSIVTYLQKAFQRTLKIFLQIGTAGHLCHPR